MSSSVGAEARRAKMTEIWTKWEGEVISGVFPLAHYHADSIRTARERAAAAGVTNARFEVADAVSFSESVR